MLGTVRMIAVVLAFSAAAIANAQGTAAGEGLVAVKSKKIDKVWLLPGADFLPYRKVILKKAEVAFQKSWVRDMNDSSASRLSRVTNADAMKIVEAARAGFDEIWAAAFRKYGYEVVAAPGEGVLEVTPRVVDLYLNAIDPSSAGGSTGMSRTYALQAGEATLNLEVRDSRTGTLLGRVSDRRETMRTPTPQMVTSARNRAEFEQLFAVWAVIAAKGLDELKANSPLPENLKPGQKVPAR